jgi:hypothetical protein
MQNFKMRNVKKLLIKISGLLLAIPSIIYVFLVLLPDVLRIVPKVGWDDRPFIYLTIESVITYIIFAFVSFVVSLELRRAIKSYSTNIGFILIGLSFLIYWLGVALCIIGIST